MSRLTELRRQAAVAMLGRDISPGSELARWVAGDPQLDRGAGGAMAMLYGQLERIAAALSAASATAFREGFEQRDQNGPFNQINQYDGTPL